MSQTNRLSDNILKDTSYANLPNPLRNVFRGLSLTFIILLTKMYGEWLEVFHVEINCLNSFEPSDAYLRQ